MRRGWSRGGFVLAAAAGAAALVLPASAVAALRPTAVTGVASNVAQQSVALNGAVNPRGAATRYVFQFGPTKASRVPTVAREAGRGTKAVRVTVPVIGLAPATRYLYRIVATNSKGTVRGKWRRFTTLRQPLGVSLGASPNPVRTGGSATLAGRLTGTGNANRQIVLQSNPWPYTGGFLNASNVLLTDANGNFSFPVLSVPVNTMYRVLMPQKPKVASPIFALGTKVRVTTHLRVRRGASSGIVRFSGRLTPAVDGTQVLIQKLVRGTWTNIGSTTARHSRGGRSVYAKSLRQRRPGRYRIYHNAVEPHVPNVGVTRRVRHMTL
jgi:hypothetical protein